MARRRVSGGKRIDRHEITSADGRKLLVDIYMVKGSGYASTKFRAICDEISLDMEGEVLDDLETRAKKEAAARSDVTWEPWLHVTVSGFRYSETEDGDDEPAKPVELFKPDGSWGSSWGRTETSFDLKIHVAAVELTTIAGSRKWREKPKKDDRSPQVRDGWPRVGREPASYYRHEPKNMSALVRDTPENRAALCRVRDTMATLTRRLDDLLGPDNAQATLAAVLAGGGPLALGAPQEPSFDIGPDGLPEYKPKPTFEELARGKDMRSGPRGTDDEEPRGRVRRRKSSQEDA